MDFGASNVRPGQVVRVESDRVAGRVRAFPEFPLSPARSVWLTNLATPVNGGDYYLARAHGYLIPPVTGDYQFWISSKGSSELWLSTNSAPAGLRKIASVPENKATNPRQWTKFPSQASETIRLTAGQPCLFDVMQEHRAGRDDTVAVAWQGPGMPLEVIDGRFLTPYTQTQSNGVLFEYWDDYLLGSIQPFTAGEAENVELVVGKATIRVLGESAFPSPVPVEIGRTFSPSQNFRWVEVQGTVGFAARGTNEYLLELVRDRSRMEVKLPVSAGLDARKLVGSRLKVRGVFEAIEDGLGGQAAGVVWVPSEREIGDISPDFGSLKRLKIVSVGELNSVNPALAIGRRLHVRGSVLQGNGGKLVLQGTARLSAFISTNENEWRLVAPPVDIAMGDKALAGLMVCSAKLGETSTAQFDSVSGILASAQDYEIGGTVPSASSTRAQGGKYIVQGVGTGFGSIFERVHFYGQPLAEEGKVAARLANLEPGQPETMAGIMIRDSTDPRVNFASLTVNAKGGVAFRFRQRPGDRDEVVSLGSVQLPCGLELTRTFPTVEVQFATNSTVALGENIELIGSLQWDGNRPVLTDCHRLDQVTTASPVSASPQSAEVTDAAVPVRIQQVVPEWNEPMREGSGSIIIRGMVTFVGPPLGTNYLVVQDETAGVLVRLNARFARRSPRVGERVELEIRSQNGKWNLPLDPVRMQILGPAQMPDAISLAAANTQIRRGEYRWVESQGIVREINPGEGFRLVSPNGDRTIRIGEGVKMDEGRLIDALVRIRAVLMYRDKATLFLPSLDYLETVEPPPETPFAMPAIMIDKVGSFARHPGTCHRVKITGVVTCKNGRTIIVQDSSGGARVKSGSANEASVGDLVEVVGFPEVEPGSIVLAQALVKICGRATMPPPALISAEGLYSGQYSDRIVQLQGELLGQRDVAGNLVLEIQSEERLFRAELPAGLSLMKSIPVGSRLQVTGVSLPERLGLPFLSEENTEMLAASFGILLRSPEDVIVLKRPPLWVWRHAPQMIGALLLVLALAMLWIRYLRMKVARRTQQLQEAMAKLEKETETSATLAERERLAGEIHDSVEQGLSAIIMQLDTAAKFVDRPNQLTHYLTLARNMAGFSRAEVHHAVWGLQSPLLENADLPTALRRVAQDISVGESPRVEVEVAGDLRSLPRDMEHHLVRAAQEAITNAVKHGRPSRIQVTLTYAAESLRLVIRDDGCGFDPQAVTDGTLHFGLKGLRTRTKKMRGQLTITSQPSAGASIEIIVPTNSVRNGLSGHHSPKPE